MKRHRLSADSALLLLRLLSLQRRRRRRRCCRRFGSPLLRLLVPSRCPCLEIDSDVLGGPHHRVPGAERCRGQSRAEREALSLAAAAAAAAVVVVDFVFVEHELDPQGALAVDPGDSGEGPRRKDDEFPGEEAAKGGERGGVCRERRGGGGGQGRGRRLCFRCLSGKRERGRQRGRAWESRGKAGDKAALSPSLPLSRSLPRARF